MVGDKGTAGDKGPTGNKGVTGNKGMVGDKGTQGDKGTDGDKGVQGDKGMSGDKGVLGDKGTDGDKGPHGDKGVQGDKGMTGTKGALGDKGMTGDTGSKGKINGTVLLEKKKSEKEKSTHCRDKYKIRKKNHTTRQNRYPSHKLIWKNIENLEILKPNTLITSAFPDTQIINIRCEPISIACTVLEHRSESLRLKIICLTKNLI